MKLIDPNKLIEYLSNPDNFKYKFDKSGEKMIMLEELIKAIQSSTKEYPYLNSTGVNIYNQNGW